MTSSELELLASLYSHLEPAAKASREFLKLHFGKATIVSQEGRDIKLAQDKASQDLIISFIRQHSDLPILAEEGGWIDNKVAGNDDIYWAVDPLDGSYNFKKGIPLCCVSIAICRGLTPIAGCVHDFLRDETFLARPDQGLTINGISMPRATSSAQVLSTGMPISTADTSIPFDDLQNQISDWKKLRMIGSAALSLSWVSAGRFDGYREVGIRWWDVAAGLALVKAGGGTISIEGNHPDQPMTIQATNF